MTYNILVIETSPMGPNSVTRKFTASVVEGLQKNHPGAIVTTRDLDASPLPHLNAQTIGAFFTPADSQTPNQRAALAASDEAVAQLLAADTIIIGVPMWNFGIPSALKAWIDHIVRAGKTFHYGANGPEGLTPKGKKVVIVSARGGVYSTGPMAAVEHHETYLRDVLGFIGLHDISFVRAEGLKMGPDAAQAALQQAQSHVAQALQHVA